MQARHDIENFSQPRMMFAICAYGDCKCPSRQIFGFNSLIEVLQQVRETKKRGRDINRRSIDAFLAPVECRTQYRFRFSLTSKFAKEPTCIPINRGLLSKWPAVLRPSEQSQDVRQERQKYRPTAWVIS